jgi:hypothetical protein
MLNKGGMKEDVDDGGTGEGGQLNPAFLKT